MSLLKNLYSPGQWYSFFFIPPKSQEMVAYYDEVVRNFASAYSSILEKDQIKGKVLTFLGVPNTFGKVDKGRLQKIYRKEISSRGKKSLNKIKKIETSRSKFKKAFAGPFKVFKSKNSRSKTVLKEESQNAEHLQIFFNAPSPGLYESSSNNGDSARGEDLLSTTKSLENWKKFPNFKPKSSQTSNQASRKQSRNLRPPARGNRREYGRIQTTCIPSRSKKPLTRLHETVVSPSSSESYVVESDIDFKTLINEPTQNKSNEELIEENKASCITEIKQFDQIAKMAALSNLADNNNLSNSYDRIITNEKYAKTSNIICEEYKNSSVTPLHLEKKNLLNPNLYSHQQRSGIIIPLSPETEDAPASMNVEASVEPNTECAKSPKKSVDFKNVEYYIYNRDSSSSATQRSDLNQRLSYSMVEECEYSSEDNEHDTGLISPMMASQDSQQVSQEMPSMNNQISSISERVKTTSLDAVTFEEFSEWEYELENSRLSIENPEHGSLSSKGKTLMGSGKLKLIQPSGCGDGELFSQEHNLEIFEMTTTTVHPTAACNKRSTSPQSEDIFENERPIANLPENRDNCIRDPLELDAPVPQMFDRIITGGLSSKHHNTTISEKETNFTPVSREEPSVPLPSQYSSENTRFSAEQTENQGLHIISSEKSQLISQIADWNSGRMFTLDRSALISEKVMPVLTCKEFSTRPNSQDLFEDSRSSQNIAVNQSFVIGAQSALTPRNSRLQTSGPIPSPVLSQDISVTSQPLDWSEMCVLQQNLAAQSSHLVGCAEEEALSQTSAVTEMFSARVTVDLNTPGAIEAIKKHCQSIFEVVTSKINSSKSDFTETESSAVLIQQKSIGYTSQPQDLFNTIAPARGEKWDKPPANISHHTNSKSSNNFISGKEMHNEGKRDDENANQKPSTSRTNAPRSETFENSIPKLENCPSTHSTTRQEKLLPFKNRLPAESASKRLEVGMCAQPLLSEHLKNSTGSNISSVRGTNIYLEQGEQCLSETHSSLENQKGMDVTKTNHSPVSGTTLISSNLRRNRLFSKENRRLQPHQKSEKLRNPQLQRIASGSEMGESRSSKGSLKLRRKHANLAWKLSLPHIRQQFFNDSKMLDVGYVSEDLANRSGASLSEYSSPLKVRKDEKPCGRTSMDISEKAATRTDVSDPRSPNPDIFPSMGDISGFNADGNGKNISGCTGPLPETTPQIGDREDPSLRGKDTSLEEPFWNLSIASQNPTANADFRNQFNQPDPMASDSETPFPKHWILDYTTPTRTKNVEEETSDESMEVVMPQSQLQREEVNSSKLFPTETRDSEPHCSLPVEKPSFQQPHSRALNYVERRTSAIRTHLMAKPPSSISGENDFSDLAELLMKFDANNAYTEKS